jgi:hypothetical protein
MEDVLQELLRPLLVLLLVVSPLHSLEEFLVALAQLPD